MKLTSRYEQTSCRLVLEGLPDLSAGQGAQTLGILTGFTLALAGRTELEGKREHLLALMAVVLPYARHLLSGVLRPFGAADQAVAISPAEGGGHTLELRSSQANTPPLTLQLDDAELADLVRCLDQMRLDPRLALGLAVGSPQPLRRGELHHRQPLRQRMAAPLVGAGALALAAVLLALLPPTPRPASTAAPTTAAAGTR